MALRLDQIRRKAVRKTDAIKAKQQRLAATTPRNWFLRSPNPSNCNNVRNVNSSGALNNNNARNANGAVDDCENA